MTTKITAGLSNLKIMVMVAVIAATGLTFNACNKDDGDGENAGSTQIGSSPVLPSYSQSAPANDEDLKSKLVAVSYHAIEGEADLIVAPGVVHATKGGNAKAAGEYFYYGIDGSASSPNNPYSGVAEGFKLTFETWLLLKNTYPTMLVAALNEDGITDFNINENSMSWKDSEGSYSIALRGEWVLVEIFEYNN